MVSDQADIEVNTLFDSKKINFGYNAIWKNLNLAENFFAIYWILSILQFLSKVKTKYSQDRR